MSETDVKHIRKRMNQAIITLIITLVPTAFIIVWTGISDHFELKNKADREDEVRKQGQLLILINEQQVTLANYMLANDEDKAALWLEIRRLQDQIRRYVTVESSRSGEVVSQIDTTKCQPLEPITMSEFY